MVLAAQTVSFIKRSHLYARPVKISPYVRPSVYLHACRPNQQVAERIFIIFLNSNFPRVLYVFFWVIPRRLNFICRRFGTLWLFHLHRQVGVECSHSTPTHLWRWNRVFRNVGIYNSNAGVLPRRKYTTGFLWYLTLVSDEGLFIHLRVNLGNYRII
jgi:hypothetical protein